MVPLFDNNNIADANIKPLDLVGGDPTDLGSPGGRPLGGALGLPQEGLGYNARFLYPRAGGIDALPRGLSAAMS